MHVKVTDVPHIVNDYMVQVIVPKLPQNLLRFGVSFLSGFIGEPVVNMAMQKYGTILTTFGIVNETGMIDIMKVKDNAMRAIKMCDGGYFTYMGYNFREDDIEALFKIAAAYAKS